MRGFVPLIHGDLILDENGDFQVCSSDRLSATILKQFPAEQLLFATDVGGVYSKDPKRFPQSKPFDLLNQPALKKLAQLPDDFFDVSGAMPAKIKSIMQVTEHFHKCYIFDGFSPASWHSLICLEEHAGTLITGTKEPRK